MRWEPGSRWLVAGGALLGCALTVLAQLAARELPKESSASQEALAEFGAARLTEGRLSGFGHAAYPTLLLIGIRLKSCSAALFGPTGNRSNGFVVVRSPI